MSYETKLVKLPKLVWNKIQNLDFVKECNANNQGYIPKRNFDFIQLLKQSSNRPEIENVFISELNPAQICTFVDKLNSSQREAFLLKIILETGFIFKKNTEGDIELILLKGKEKYASNVLESLCNFADKIQITISV